MKLSELFEKLPEIPIKNDIRYFLSFNPMIPALISNLSPIKGYEQMYPLKEGDVVVDAGAYPGDYTIWASRKVGASGRVIAFEPTPQNKAILERNLKREKYDNVTIVPKGLWNENTTLNLSGTSGFSASVSADNTGDTIEVSRLDDALEELGIEKIDVLKMDIEGAEIEAIQGCEKTLRNNVAEVMVATYHIVNGQNTSSFIEEFLKRCGYEAETTYPSHLTTHGWRKHQR